MSAGELTLSELQQAILVGGQRMLRAIRKARSEPYGHPSERGDWDVVIEGAAAEMAVAKALRLYWGDSPALDYNGDVGRYQVRSTDHADGHLILYERDADDATFVLVTGRAPAFTVRGFILARDGKRDEYLANGRLRSEGWMVPQSALRPIRELS